jgi:DNA-binding Xre family transcriptional regulator
VKQTSAIEQLLKDNNKNKIWLSEKLGYAGPSGISQMLMRGNITVETLCRICDALDYEVTVQPKRRVGVRPNGQIIIDGRGRE